MNEKLFWIDEYMEIHQLAYKYQDGDKEAGEELLKRFEVFKLKYLNLFRNKECNVLSDTSVRNFLKLFIENKADRQILNAYMFLENKENISVCKKITKVVNITVRKISNIFSQLDDEDIEQSLNLILLEMFKKYKDNKPSLHHYINQTFHFYLYRFLELQSKDPIARGHVAYKQNTENGDNLVDKICDNKNYESEEEALNFLEIELVNKMNGLKTISKKKTSIYEDEFLNNDWIDGITCSSMFKVLTKMERHILVKWYIENKTDSFIANGFGLCRATINKRRISAKNKLLIEAVKRKYVKE